MPTPRRRRPWHAQKPFAREPGDLHRRPPGRLTVLEGEWAHPRTVIIEFPSREAAEGWYNSPAYQKIISLRLKSTVGNLVILDGA
jgi:uncharacterized protein (DUF1330 family)